MDDPQEETLQQEEQSETPTNEDQLKTLQAELEQAKKLAEEKDKGLRTAHQTLTQKDREIKNLSDFNQKIDGIENKIKILAAATATGMRVDENELDSMSPQAQKSLLSEFDRLDAETKAKAEQARKEAEESEYRTKADSLWQEAQSLSFDEDTLDKIEDALTWGKLERAERLISRKKETPKETKVEESVEEKAERLAQEKFNKLLEEKGLLETDTAISSGRTATEEDIIARAASGDASVSREELRKALKL